MNCPKCKEYNPKDSFYCHNCGNKLKTKINGWMICSLILIASTILLGVLTFNYADSMIYYKSNYSKLYQEKQYVSKQLNNKNSEISRLKSEISQLNNKNSEISRLKSEISQLKIQQPQTYITKYTNQSIYYWNGSFKETDYKYSDKGTWVDIYTQKEGYGLTDWGWIPMNRLEKK